jgi:hypothetical protein
MAQMEQPKFESEIANIFFLARLGTTFRCLSSDIVREEIPAEMERLLRQLERAVNEHSPITQGQREKQC